MCTHQTSSRFCSRIYSWDQLSKTIIYFSTLFPAELKSFLSKEYLDESYASVQFRHLIFMERGHFPSFFIVNSNIHKNVSVSILIGFSVFGTTDQWEPVGKWVLDTISQSHSQNTPVMIHNYSDVWFSKAIKPSGKKGHLPNAAHVGQVIIHQHVLNKCLIFMLMPLNNSQHWDKAKTS